MNCWIHPDAEAELGDAADTLSVSGRDMEHSVGEARFVTLALSSTGRVLVVCHTDRGSVIRIFSARPAIRNHKRKRSKQRRAKEAAAKHDLGDGI